LTLPRGGVGDLCFPTLRVFLESETEVGGLAYPLQKIGSRLFRPLRTQVNVMVNIVNAHNERAEREFGGVGLQLRPSRARPVQ
jgi:hypothetical protein